VGVRHARINFEIGISFRIGPDVVADLSDSIVSSTHESLDIKVVCRVEDPYYVLGIFETHQLGASFLFRQMVDAEKLIITEQDSIHSHTLIRKAFTAEAKRTQRK
jgi:hypothetical protein